MSAAPAVSVVLPVHNAMPFLPRALRALQEQTFEDFEVVLHDDGSDDGSREVAQAVAAKDGRFRVASEPRRGVVHATNEATARARGALLVRCDADDVSASMRLACLVRAAEERPEVGFFASRTRFFPRAVVRDGMRHYEAWINGVLSHEDVVRERFVELPLAQPSWALRREVFDRLGGYREGPFPEDYDFFLRAVEAGVRFHKLDAVLVAWREGAHRTSRNDPRYGLDRFLELKVRHLASFLDRLGRPVAVVGAGPDGKRLARRLGEAGVAPQWFVDVHPRRLGQVIHGAEVVGYDALARLEDAFLLAAVGQRGARDEVRRLLAEAGRREGEDFLCAQ